MQVRDFAENALALEIILTPKPFDYFIVTVVAARPLDRQAELAVSAGPKPDANRATDVEVAARLQASGATIRLFADLL